MSRTTVVMKPLISGAPLENRNQQQNLLVETKDEKKEKENLIVLEDLFKLPNHSRIWSWPAEELKKLGVVIGKKTDKRYFFRTSSLQSSSSSSSSLVHHPQNSSSLHQQPQNSSSLHQQPQNSSSLHQQPQNSSSLHQQPQNSSSLRHQQPQNSSSLRHQQPQNSSSLRHQQPQAQQPQAVVEMCRIERIYPERRTNYDQDVTVEHVLNMSLKLFEAVKFLTSIEYRDQVIEKKKKEKLEQDEEKKKERQVFIQQYIPETDEEFLSFVEKITRDYFAELFLPGNVDSSSTILIDSFNLENVATSSITEFQKNCYWFAGGDNYRESKNQKSILEERMFYNHYPILTKFMSEVFKLFDYRAKDYDSVSFQQSLMKKLNFKYNAQLVEFINQKIAGSARNSVNDAGSARNSVNDAGSARNSVNDAGSARNNLTINSISQQQSTLTNSQPITNSQSSFNNNNSAQPRRTFGGAGRR